MILENEKLIPLDGWDSTWLDYKGKAYIIRTDPTGTGASYQYDGTSCLEGYIKGFIFAEFKTKAKYYNPNFWDDKTSWGNDYPNKIFFLHSKIPEYNDFNVSEIDFENDKYFGNFESLEERNEAEIAIAEKYGILGETILNSIIKTAMKKTGLIITPSFTDKTYGTYWWEARIPIKFGDNLQYDGLLTWENCD